MNIRQHFIASAIASAIIGTGILIAGYWMVQNIIKMNQQTQSIAKSISATNQLTLLTIEYLYKGGKRTQSQWHKAHKLLEISIKKLPHHDEDGTIHIVDKLPGELKRMKKLFISLSDISLDNNESFLLKKTNPATAKTDKPMIKLNIESSSLS